MHLPIVMVSSLTSSVMLFSFHGTRKQAGLPDECSLMPLRCFHGIAFAKHLIVTDAGRRQIDLRVEHVPQKG